MPSSRHSMRTALAGGDPAVKYNVGFDMSVADFVTDWDLNEKETGKL